jgi:hypothetical protein
MIKSIGDFISTQKNSLSTLCKILEGFACIFLQIVVFVGRINACRVHVYDKIEACLLEDFVEDFAVGFCQCEI